ncbi:cache domain-containing sensor histidine kinase [Paenibacillus hamazuiensis]|uniref:cache domain-containing sensor histidine kinase n=1 Tax=Paenibacillus hamazuiensis TaxID=2936508 RepID=UPI00200DF917|nr:histidine kinase [Paenibacillus hamazuiensis]
MKKASLYRKLLLYFLLVIIVSLTSVGVFTYRMSSRELDRQVKEQMAQIAGNALHHTDLYLKSYERAIVSLLTSKDVKRFVDLPENREDYTYYEVRRSIKEFSIEPIFIRNPEIAAVYIISFSGNAVYYYNDIPGESFKPRDIQEQLQFFGRTARAGGKLTILNHSILEGQQNKMLTFVRQIRGLSSPEPRGYLAIEMRNMELSALWKGIDLGKSGYFFIVDENGQVIHHPDSGKIGTMVDADLRGSLSAAGDRDFVAKENGQERMYMSRRSDYSGWNLVVSMPLDEVMKPVSNIRLTTIVVGGFTLVFALWLAYRLSKSITGPIQVLKNGMRETEKGNWVMIPLPDQRDEIAELMVRYNTMVKRLSELVDQVYAAELNNQQMRMERQQAEFQSLQLQINPHFLYNTLETIVCYAVVRDSEEISEIVKALAYMLRYSVQTNLEEITVANELKHVLYYLVVLRHRIGRDFEIDVAIEPQYLLKNMVRLTLQPLVENAFQHAFPDGVEDYHYIRIDAGVEDGRFWVSVEDNGAGMSEARLSELREKLRANRLAEQGSDAAGGKGGIGIVNVHRRIQMVFGEQYGLSIESEEDRGTKLIMVMPESVPGRAAG